METKLIWSTPNAADLLVYMARVSNPANQILGLNSVQLIKYLLGWRKGELSRQKPHWSPFEMVHACVEVTTTRDIARQILRHRSFAFQEFSQRYATTEALPAPDLRETRLQDPTNRQSSLPSNSAELNSWWGDTQIEVAALVGRRYVEALQKGIAKEVARAILPEGLTPTRLYMCGSFRSWIHYFAARTDSDTQKEHRAVAWSALSLIRFAEPTIITAVEETEDEYKARHST